MARFLAVDWDDNEIRYLLASLKKDRLTTLKIGSAPLEHESGDENDPLAAPLRTFRTRFKERRLEKCRTSLLLGRSAFDMFPLELPAASDAELPDMVKNQVMRELPGFFEVDPVDYIPITDQAAPQRRLLALTLSAVRRQKLQRAFRTLGFPIARLGSRNVAAAELALRSDLFVSTRKDAEADAPATPEHPSFGSTDPILIVTILTNEVELTTLLDRKIVALRSFKLPESLDNEEFDERVAAEIVRTATIGVPDESDQPIKRMILYGTQEEHEPLVRLLQDRELDVLLVNPFEIHDLVCDERPEFPGRYAPLLGALRAVGEGRREAVDFLAPKEKPRPVNHARLTVMALLIIAILGYGLYQWNAVAIGRLTVEADRLSKERDDLAAEIKKYANQYFILNRTRIWDMQGANWLDELRDISINFPGAEDLVITQMTFDSGPINNNPNITGAIRLRGMVRDLSVLRLLQQKLHQGRFHRMQFPAPSRNPAGGGYPWLFSTTIYVFRRANPMTYLQSLSPELQRESYYLPNGQPATPPKPGDPSVGADSGVRPVPIQPPAN